MSNKEAVITQLNTIDHPVFSCKMGDPIVLKSCSIVHDSDVTIQFLDCPGSDIIQALMPSIESALFSLRWVQSLDIQLSLFTPTPFDHSNLLGDVKHIIAVSSCKGGVGKSTIAYNLATALKMNGAQVGLFDADIHGPSLPTLIQPIDILATQTETGIPPFVNHGMKLMSYGYVQQNTNHPAILRGPIASNIFKQLLCNTEWGYLDYLIIDCPPGTGDIILSITQEVQLSAALIVTTPHQMSYVDVEKGIEMFNKVSVPNFAIVENMSYFKCSTCSERHAIFGSGRLALTTNKFDIDYAYQLPLTDTISSYSNTSLPYLMACEDDSDDRIQFKQMANDCAWFIFNHARASDIVVSFDNSKRAVCIDYGAGQRSLAYDALRLECNCAHCVDEFTQERLITPDGIDPCLSIESIRAVGHYAYNIVWNEYSSTHQSLFSIDRLTQLLDAEGQK